MNTNKDSKKSEAIGVIPFYLTNFDGLFMSTQPTSDSNTDRADATLAALQSMVKEMERGGKLRFKVINPEKNDEDNKKPNAWLEYFTAAQVEKSRAAFAKKKGWSKPAYDEDI